MSDVPQEQAGKAVSLEQAKKVIDLAAMHGLLYEIGGIVASLMCLTKELPEDVKKNLLGVLRVKPEDMRSNKPERHAEVARVSIAIADILEGPTA